MMDNLEKLIKAITNDAIRGNGRAIIAYQNIKRYATTETEISIELIEREVIDYYKDKNSNNKGV